MKSNTIRTTIEVNGYKMQIEADSADELAKMIRTITRSESAPEKKQVRKTRSVELSTVKAPRSWGGRITRWTDEEVMTVVDVVRQYGNTDVSIGKMAVKKFKEKFGASLRGHTAGSISGLGSSIKIVLVGGRFPATSLTRAVVRILEANNIVAAGTADSVKYGKSQSITVLPAGKALTLTKSPTTTNYLSDPVAA